jgi:hypothetical protein
MISKINLGLRLTDIQDKSWTPTDIQDKSWTLTERILFLKGVQDLSWESL